MKLYYAPSACSLSPHIALREAGAKFTLEKVDTRAKTTASGGDFKAINPKGYVPVLELDDGQVLTESAAIVQYIADRHPSARLAPPVGSFERYRLQEWLNFIATELHKGFSPLFRPNTPDAYKVIAKENLAGRFDWLSGQLEGKAYKHTGVSFWPDYHVTDDRMKIEWVVTAKSGDTVKLTARHERAGTMRAEVKLA